MNLKQKVVWLKTRLPWIIFVSWFLFGSFYTMAGAAIGRNGIIDHFDFYGNHTVEYTFNYTLGFNMVLQGFTVLGTEICALTIYGITRQIYKKQPT